MYILNIKNFQRYRDETMEIKGFTVLEGPSNLGKSSIRRALGVVTQNIWEANFVSVGAKNTVISLETDDIHIQATKGSANEFIVKKGSEQFDYKKAGKDIPKEIIGAGFSPLTIGKEKINLLMAKQYDPLFMVSYSDQQNTKILNTVFDVDTIEKANELVIKDIASQKRELKREIQFKEDKEKELSDLEIELEKMNKLRAIYDKIDMIDSHKDCKSELQETLDEVTRLEKVLSKIGKLVSLNRAYTKATELQNKLKRYKEVSIILKGLETQLKSLLPIKDKLDLLKQFKTDREEYSLLKKDLVDIAKEIQQTERLGVLNSSILRLNDYQSKAKRLLNAGNRLNDLNKMTYLISIQDKLELLTMLPFTKWRIKGKNEELRTVKDSILLFNEEYKSFGRCPCCNSKI